MKIKKSIIIITLFLFVMTTDTYPYKFDFVTVSDIVKKVKKRFGELESYQASFTITSEKMGKKKVHSGLVQYKSSDRLLMRFYSPPGQKIISDGKMMWIYIPSLNVVAEQDLKANPGIFSSNTKSGLKRLFSKYHYKFDSKKQPEAQKDGSKMYTLYLKQKESRSGYRYMRLWVSEDFLITRAKGETSSGKKIEIQFRNIKTNIDIPNGTFKFSIPARARVIKNPMISEE
jgi:outer membrane lipoprotein carrier protein